LPDAPADHGYWLQTQVGNVGWILLGGFVLIAAFVFAYLFFDRRTRQRILDERWVLFRRMCKDRALSREEVGYLRELQQRAVPDRPHLLVTSLNFYDGAVEAEMHRVEIESRPFEERSVLANAYINIREKLFFGEAMAKARVHSTLDLEPGQHLRIELPGKPGTYEAQVMTVSDSSLTISMPGQKGVAAELVRGDKVVAYLAVRNDGGYRFETGVAGLREGRVPAVHLWHTERLERQQLRTWMRMSMEVPVRFYRIKFPDLSPPGDGTPLPVPPEKYGMARHEQLFTGMMRDFSLGGVCLRTEADFRRGQYAGVLIPIFGDDRDEPTEEIEILGRVVGATLLETVRNRLYNVHVEFVPLDEATRSLLMANMFQLQRKLGKKAKP
jgi:c-di-GMP-binding flagellar brake protein YcgR